MQFKRNIDNEMKIKRKIAYTCNEISYNNSREQTQLSSMEASGKSWDIGFTQIIANRRHCRNDKYDTCRDVWVCVKERGIQRIPKNKLIWPGNKEGYVRAEAIVRPFKIKWE